MTRPDPTPGSDRRPLRERVQDLPRNRYHLLAPDPPRPPAELRWVLVPAGTYKESSALSSQVRLEQLTPALTIERLSNRHGDMLVVDIGHASILVDAAETTSIERTPFQHWLRDPDLYYSNGSDVDPKPKKRE